jgi:branched-chain amino acid transport system ATP-binding protein
MMDTVLDIRKVSKRFGGVVALDGVDLSLGKGEILGLIGPNGSGKTTMVNVVSGYVRPTSGAIAAGGRALEKMPPHRIARAGISRTFQNLRIFRRRTVLENILVGQASRVSLLETFMPFATGRHSAARDGAFAVLERFGLVAKAHEVAGALSFGEQKRLELARAMVAEPQVLLLDEPAGGMNPTEIDELKETLRSIRNDGVSILLIEHNMRLVMEVCDRLAVLCFGKFIADGAPDAIRNDPAVIESYLGRRKS